MRQRGRVVLEPRKSPVQARSAASVDALLEATIQVLLKVGKERLTTTKVAVRAGVSVGTLYQYFPNKSALLQAALRRHLATVVEEVELVCKEQAGKRQAEMVAALITTFLDAKMRDAGTSVALHAVSSDVDGAAVVQEMGLRFHQAVVEMLCSSCEPLRTDPQVVAFVLQAAVAGVGRSLLESGYSRERFEHVRRELISLGCAYVRTAVSDGMRGLEPGLTHP